jgi:hypothetical protein
MNHQKIFSQHSELTDPKCHADGFAELPDDVTDLCNILRGVVLHFGDASSRGVALSPARLAEMDLRNIKHMLTRLSELNAAPLIATRLPSQRLVGCCRDFALLLCAILRHKKIPARVRYGFSVLHMPGFHHDQTLLEYWHAPSQRWCLVDPRADSHYRQKFNLPARYDFTDIPRDLYLTAADAWQQCRQGMKPPAQFGTGQVQRLTGLWFVRNKLLQDFAAINKNEMLLWDAWGAMLHGFNLPAAHLPLLDEIAELMLHPDENLPAMAWRFCHPDLYVPKRVVSFSLARGRQEVVVG